MTVWTAASDRDYDNTSPDLCPACGAEVDRPGPCEACAAELDRIIEEWRDEVLAHQMANTGPICSICKVRDTVFIGSDLLYRCNQCRREFYG